MKKALYVLSFIALIFNGCNSGSEPVPVLPPEKASLSFPELNALCTQGSLISATQSIVIFKWLGSANTDSYELNLKNLLTGTITKSTASSNQLAVTLNLNTPYSWSVTSISSKTSTLAHSDTWKFYNSGPGILSYAPYPAEIVTPFMMQNIDAVGGNVTFSWTGSDVDNDIVNYDVYFGTTTTPNLYKEAVATATLAGVPVTSGTTYYWKVITKDAKGNTSDSGLSQFRIN